MPVVVVGNKQDLQSREREVPADALKALSDKWRCPVMEVSAFENRVRPLLSSSPPSFYEPCPALPCRRWRRSSTGSSTKWSCPEGTSNGRSRTAPSPDSSLCPPVSDSRPSSSHFTHSAALHSTPVQSRPPRPRPPPPLLPASSPLLALHDPAQPRLFVRAGREWSLLMNVWMEAH